MNHYILQNLYEASYLLTKGFKIVSKDSTGQKTRLIFENTPALQQAVMDFYNGSGKVTAKTYVEQYRHLKDLVFQR